VAVLRELGPEHIAFCTDDRDPEDIAEDGHINGMVRKAVAAGVAPEDALVVATLNPARWHGLQELGALAPGYRADVLVLPDLEEFRPELVLKRGKPLGDIARPDVPEWVRQTVRIAPVGASDLTAPSDGSEIRVIGLVPDQVVTEALVERPTVVDGFAVADPPRDLAKIAVVERHLATGRVGVGFVRGSGLGRGALGSTVAHDAHNIVVLGASDEDMLAVVKRLVELGGGNVVVDDGRVVAECPLPVAGLLSDAPLADVIAQSRACNEAAAALGWTGQTPFLTMSFLALTVIPSLKITDRGLVDVDRFELVPLAEGTRTSRTVPAP
jgi:adenine deaminase